LILVLKKWGSQLVNQLLKVPIPAIIRDERWYPDWNQLLKLVKEWQPNLF
jgi:RNase H-fold protein (predicted Holliday junction resolvase)